VPLEPLEAEAAVSDAEAALAPPGLSAPNDWRDLVGSPLRGRQAALLAGIAALLAGVAALEVAAGAAGCVAFLPRTLLIVLIPGLMSDLARHAAAGFRNLEEWPDYSAPVGRLYELLLFAVVGMLALLPAAWIGGALGCAERVSARGGVGPVCALGLAGGLWLSALAWPLPFAAAARGGRFGAALDIASHLRRARAAPRALVSTATLGWAAMVLPVALRALLPAGALLGVLVEALLGVYGALVAARAAGLLLARTDAAA
jgi:hypothetical protein